MLKERNQRFSGPWDVLSNHDQKSLESYRLKENARRAAKSLTQHEKTKGRKTSYTVAHVLDWEKL